MILLEFNTKASAISSSTLAPDVPDAKACVIQHPYSLIASIGFVFLRRMNSVSKPTRNSTPEPLLAFLHNR
jgi:hypothetical protein